MLNCQQKLNQTPRGYEGNGCELCKSAKLFVLIAIFPNLHSPCHLVRPSQTLCVFNKVSHAYNFSWFHASPGHDFAFLIPSPSD